MRITRAPGVAVRTETRSNDGVSIAITEEQRAIGESIKAWAAGAGVLATVRGTEGAKHWREHWADLAHLGLFAMVLPDEDGSVADLAAALEQTAAGSRRQSGHECCPASPGMRIDQVNLT